MASLAGRAGRLAKCPRPATRTDGDGQHRSIVETTLSRRGSSGGQDRERWRTTAGVHPTLASPADTVPPAPFRHWDEAVKYARPAPDGLPPDAPPNTCRSLDSAGRNGIPTGARQARIPADQTWCSTAVRYSNRP